MGESEELFERSRELALLSQALERARSGTGGVVLLSGEAGIGKTSVLRAFLATLPEDVVALTGAGEDLHTSRVLGPFREMFPDHQLPDADRAVELLLAPPDGSSAVVAVVDDAHWADDASLDVIRYVGRRVGATRLLLVVAFRRDDGPDDQALRSLLGVLVDPAVLRIELTGLSEGVVRELARKAGLPWDRVRDLGGNPFLVTEVLRAPHTELPTRIRDVVVGRVAALPAPVRDLMETLAVVPGAAPLEVLEGLGVGDIALVDAATRAGLVQLRRGRVSYHHEISRRAMQSSMSAAARSLLHRRVLAVLEGLDADPALLLHHALGAQDQRAVARHAPTAAARGLRAEAHRETLTAARAALADDVPTDPAVRAAMHGMATQACFSLNRLTEAWDHACSAVEGWSEVARGSAPHAQALVDKARIAGLRGEAGLVAVCAGDIISFTGPAPTPALVQAHATLANLAAISGDSDGALRHGARGAAVADALGDPALQACVAVSVSLARAASGDVRGAVEALEHAVGVLRAHGDAEQEGRALANLAVIHLAVGDTRLTRRHLEAAVALAQEHDQASLRYFATAHLANLDLVAGQWDRAETSLREILDTQPDAAALRTLPEAFLGRLLLRRGRPEGRELLADAWRGSTASGQVRRMLHAAAGHLELAWLDADPVAGRRWGDRCLDLAERCGSPVADADARRWLRLLALPVEPPESSWSGRQAEVAVDPGPFESAVTMTGSTDPATAVRGVRALERLGAVATADRVRSTLRERGVRGLPRRTSTSQRSTTRARSGLTPRQHEVLSLVAEGLSTREIADRLYLSGRTVDNHIGAALDRLMVSDRRAAVRAAGLGAGPEQSGAGPAESG